MDRQRQRRRVKRLAIRFAKTIAHKIEASSCTRKCSMILIKILMLLIAIGLRTLRDRAQLYLRISTVGPNQRCASSGLPTLCKTSSVFK